MNDGVKAAVDHLKIRLGGESLFALSRILAHLDGEAERTAAATLQQRDLGAANITYALRRAEKAEAERDAWRDSALEHSKGRESLAAERDALRAQVECADGCHGKPEDVWCLACALTAYRAARAQVEAARAGLEIHSEGWALRVLAAMDGAKP